MENKLPAIRVDENVLAKKSEAWSQLGAEIYKKELQLQAIAQLAISKIYIPTTVGEVAAAELNLKQLKAANKQVEDMRKEITNKFRDVADRLMISEKSFEPNIKILTEAIIVIKKAEEKKQAADAAKNAEVKNIREQVQRTLANVNAEFKTKIVNQISNAYEWALNNSVKPEKLQEYVNKCSGKLNLIDFTKEFGALSFKTMYVAEADIRKIITECYLLDSNSFLEQYRNDLKAKFEFYGIDFANKAQALEKAAEDKALAEQNIQSEKANEQMSANLENIATNLTETFTVKKLKKSYKVEMVDSLPNALVIISAFAANLEMCRAKLRVKSYFNLTIGQMADSLAACKNDDNIFQPQNIIFKEVEKL